MGCQCQWCEYCSVNWDGNGEIYGTPNVNWVGYLVDPSPSPSPSHSFSLLLLLPFINTNCPQILIAIHPPKYFFHLLLMNTAIFAFFLVLQFINILSLPSRERSASAEHGQPHQDNNNFRARYVPKFSRFTPFLTPESLPGPQFGRPSQSAPSPSSHSHETGHERSQQQPHGPTDRHQSFGENGGPHFRQTPKEFKDRGSSNSQEQQNIQNPQQQQLWPNKSSIGPFVTRHDQDQNRQQNSGSANLTITPTTPTTPTTTTELLHEFPKPTMLIGDGKNDQERAGFLLNRREFDTKSTFKSGNANVGEGGEIVKLENIIETNNVSNNISNNAILFPLANSTSFPSQTLVKPPSFAPNSSPSTTPSSHFASSTLSAPQFLQQQLKFRPNIPYNKDLVAKLPSTMDNAHFGSPAGQFSNEREGRPNGKEEWGRRPNGQNGPTPSSSHGQGPPPSFFTNPTVGKGGRNSAEGGGRGRGREESEREKPGGNEGGRERDASTRDLSRERRPPSSAGHNAAVTPRSSFGSGSREEAGRKPPSTGPRRSQSEENSAAIGERRGRPSSPPFSGPNGPQKGGGPRQWPYWQRGRGGNEGRDGGGGQERSNQDDRFGRNRGRQRPYSSEEVPSSHRRPPPPEARRPPPSSGSNSGERGIQGGGRPLPYNGQNGRSRSGENGRSEENGRKGGSGSREDRRGKPPNGPQRNNDGDGGRPNPNNPQFQFQPPRGIPNPGSFLPDHIREAFPTFPQPFAFERKGQQPQQQRQKHRMKRRAGEVRISRR